MEDERPEKMLKLDTRRSDEHNEILRLNEKVKDLEDLLVLRNRKNSEMEESRSNIETEKVKLEVERNKVEKEKSNIQEDETKAQEERNKIREEKNDMESKKVEFEGERNQVEAEKKTMEERKRKLEEAVGKIVKKLRQLVECPVCLSMPREGPVPCCVKGHIVCCPCLNRLRGEGRLGCPTCREPMGKGKSLLALVVIEEIQHECRNQG